MLARAAKTRAAAADARSSPSRLERRREQEPARRCGSAARRSPRSCCRPATTASPPRTALARQEQTVKIAPATGTTFDAMLATGRLELTRRARHGGRSRPTPVHRRRDVHRLRGRSGCPAGAPRGGALGRSRARPSRCPPAPTTSRRARRRRGARADRHRRRRCRQARRAARAGAPQARRHARRRARARQPAAHLHASCVSTASRARSCARIAKEPELDLSAGRYRIEAALGATNVIAATEIALAAGQAQKITLKLEAGQRHAEARERAARARATCSGRCGTTSSAPSCAPASRSRRRCSRPAATSSPPRRATSRCAAPSKSKAGEHRTFDFGGLSGRRPPACSHISTNLVPRAWLRAYHSAEERFGRA